MTSRTQQGPSRHISVSSFDGMVTEVGTVGSTDTGAYFVRCHEAPHRGSGLLDFGALQDPTIYTGFHYQDGQWSFVMRRHSQTED